MASESPGYVGRMEDAYGDEVEFSVSAPNQVMIECATRSIILDSGSREQFQRLFMEAERQAEAVVSDG